MRHYTHLFRIIPFLSFTASAVFTRTSLYSNPLSTWIVLRQTVGPSVRHEENQQARIETFSVDNVTQNISARLELQVGLTRTPAFEAGWISDCPATLDAR
jgi:hypothetical protein